MAEAPAVTWAEFEAAAPRLAETGRARLDEPRVALLGTLRKDGAPRISPIEPFFTDEHLLVGAMSWSAKARDLARDPRFVLHSVVTAPNAGESEFKLYGRARSADDALRERAVDAWWLSQPDERAAVFSLEVVSAALVEWNLARGEMTLVRWSPVAGVRELRRSYP